MTVKSLLKSAAHRTLGVALGGVMAAAMLGGAANAEAPLWVVKDKDSTVYLFGTVHLLKKDVVWNTPAVQKAMADSKETYFEIVEVDGGDQAAMQQLVGKYGVDPAKPLSAKLSAEQNAKLATVAAKYGMQPAQLEPLKPWLAALTFSLLPLQAAGFDPNAGVDKLLKAQAVTEGDQIKAFETVEQQLKFFADLPEAQQVAYLDYVLDDAGEGLAVLESIVAAWAAGDVDKMAEVFVTEMKTETPELYDLLLTKRNVDWANQIDTLMKGSGSHFVAVGAGHLVGPDSVQAQLAKKGIKAERVK